MILRHTALFFFSMVFATAPAIAEEPAASRSYSVPLALSYAVLPALTVAGAVALNDSESDAAVAAATVTIGVVGLATPAAVHALNGEGERAGIAPLGTLAATAAGALIGVGIGALVADAECPERTTGSEEADQCKLRPVVLSVLIGSGLGYLGWATFDVATRSTVEPPVKVAVAPLVSRSTAGLSVSGAF
ncbi:MAG TPA: hypothetical protein VHE30_11745 [Polyangiaceae bacterium]|nr:hypothetical protein [Polyangiaceae bacterium]